MKVKICGITSREDAHAAIQAGADVLGFIFHKASPRYIGPTDAGEIVRTIPAQVLTVGVFVNAPRQLILKAIAETGIGCIQLHGDEAPEYSQGFPVPVWKAFRVQPDFDVEELKRFRVAAYLLDTYARGRRGGTGRTFDWSIAVRAKRFGNIVLSGGITPENVGEAIHFVRPYAIDVNSGVESSGGKKDRRKLEELFSNIKSVQESACL